jgi:hypothetical protein
MKGGVLVAVDTVTGSDNEAGEGTPVAKNHWWKRRSTARVSKV